MYPFALRRFSKIVKLSKLKSKCGQFWEYIGKRDFISIIAYIPIRNC